MNEYVFFIGAFQPLDAEYLRQLIVSQSTLSSTFLGLDTNSDTVGGVDGFDILTFFSAPLSGDSQSLLTAIVSGYMTSVPVAKMKKLAELKTTIQNYIEAHYDILTRQQLLSLYTLSKFDSLTNRAAYIRPGLDWINSIIFYATTASAAIQAFTVFGDVSNYVIDVGSNVSPDPLLTVGAAILIST